MRVLHIVPSYVPAYRYGGPIYSVHALCQALTRQPGMTLEVWTTAMDGPNNLQVALAQVLIVEGVQVRYFEVPYFRRLFYAPSLTTALQKELANFDLLHLHSVYLHPTYSAAKAAQALGRPYVWSPRGMLVPELINGRNSLLKRTQIALFERYNLNRASLLHFTSTAESHDYARCKLPQRPELVLENGVDAPALPTVHAPRSGLLFVGRISWKKGLDRLLRALALLPQDLVLKIAGNDEENLQPQLMQLAVQLGVSARVRWLGSVLGAAKWQLYSQAAVTVVPSMSENFGNVVVEALAMGCPVVTTPGVGASTVVEACNGGEICDGSSAALAAAITRLLTSDEAPARSARASAHVRATLGWDAIAQRMASAYREVLAH